MKNLTIQLGSAHTRPRVRTPRPLPGRTRLSAAPPPDTVPRPTCQPLLLSSVRLAARARRTSSAPAGFGPLPAGRRSPVGRDPPLLVARVLHASAPFSLQRPHSEHPAANLISVRSSHPRSTNFPRPNSSRSTAVVHPLGEPPTEPFPRQS
jgi:hypothetical protein